MNGWDGNAASISGSKSVDAIAGVSDTERPVSLLLKLADFIEFEIRLLLMLKAFVLRIPGLIVSLGGSLLEAIVAVSGARLDSRKGGTGRNERGRRFLGEQGGEYGGNRASVLFWAGKA